MTTMQARPRLVTTSLALATAVLLAGCGDDSGTSDPLAALAAEYQSVLADRPVVRESPDAADDSAGTLRQLAQRTQTAGRESDEVAASILAAGMRSAAGAFELDEALRAESRAATLRQLVRALAADADLLAETEASARDLDLGDTTILLESRFATAREQLARADAELDDLRDQTALAEGQRDAHLRDALDFDRDAAEFSRRALETDPISGRDFAFNAARIRGQAHEARVEAAIDDISVQTIAPTLALADARRSGASDTVDAAREAREAADLRVAEARDFALEVRVLLDEMQVGTDEALRGIATLEDELVLPRLEAAIADHEAAVGLARALTRGGSREDSTAGWRAIANNQFAAGRAQWEIATVLGRRADLLARLARGGVLVDPAAAAAGAEAALEVRAVAIAAAEAAFNEALGSLANIQGGDASATTIRDTIQQALAGLQGETMTLDTTPAATGAARAGGSGGTSAGGAGGRGFGTPAEAAAFLSDDSNAMSPAGFRRLEAALKADTPGGKAIGQLLTAAGVTMPVIEALIGQFGEADVMAALEETGMGPGGGGMSLVPSTTFTVDSTQGDEAILVSKDGSQRLTLVKTGGGWMLDLDATVEADPQAQMMAQMMGPMIEQMVAPIRAASGPLVKRIESGEFTSLDDAIAAIEETMSSSMPQGMPGGF